MVSNKYLSSKDLSDSMDGPEGVEFIDINLERVCRTCLQESDNMQSVFIRDDQPCVSIMVTSCTQIKVIEGDGLPKHICCKCLKNVTLAFSFKLQAEKADAKLRNYIARKRSDVPLESSASIKEEHCIQDQPDMVVKTEIRNGEFSNESQNNDIYEQSMDNSFNQSDDSEDDVKPLKDLKELALKIANEDAKKKSRKIVLPCEFCSKKFVSLSNLENHKHKHHAGCVQCDICLRAFTKSTYLERHKIASHYKSTPSLPAINKDGEQMDLQITCKLCSFTFAREEQLISHIALSHNGPRKRGRPSKKDLLLSNIRIKKILDTMNIKSENDDIRELEVSETHSDLFDAIPRKKVHESELFTDIKNCDNYCNLCNKPFASFNLYEKHIKKHLVHKLLICKICDKTFKCNTSLKKHFQSHEELESFANIDLKTKISLLENSEKFTSEDAQNLSDSDIIKLIIADIKAEKFNSYTGEIKSEIEQEIISDNEDCVSINGDSESIENKANTLFIKPKFKKSLLRKYKSSLKCSLCGQEFTKTNHLMRHMSVHNYEYPDTCDLCNKPFPNKDFLLKHKCMQSATKSYRCNSCSMRFTYEMSLNKHILRQHKGESVSINFLDPLFLKKEKTFVCQNCNKSFYRQEHLDKHAKTHLPHEKKFECLVCQKKFNRKDNLRSHLRVHEPNKDDLDSNCLCVYCGRSFSNSSNLIVHMRRHTGEKPYKCDLCGKGFPRSSDLQCHRRTHTGEKPCLCTICGKGFSRSNKLVRHMRIHTGQRPYKCTYCDRAFTQSNDLTLHVRRHTGDKPYSCGVCGARFIQGTALQSHRRMQGHYEQGTQTAPFPLNSVNNPNRSNTVRRIASSVETNLKLKPLDLLRPSTSLGSEATASGTSTETNRTIEEGPNLHTTHSMGRALIQSCENGVTGFLTGTSILDGPTPIPLFSLTQFNPGYN